MAKQTDVKPAQGEHIDIPAISPIAGNVAMRTDTGGQLWSLSAILVFLMAAALPVAPMTFIVLLIRQPDTATYGLTWLWIALGIITEMIAFLTAYGLVHSVLEGEA